MDKEQEVEVLRLGKGCWIIINIQGVRTKSEALIKNNALRVLYKEASPFSVSAPFSDNINKADRLRLPQTKRKHPLPTIKKGNVTFDPGNGATRGASGG